MTKEEIVKDLEIAMSMGDHLTAQRIKKIIEEIKNEEQFDKAN